MIFFVTLLRYRRYTDRHVFEDELFRHKDDIEDMDISPFDECILFICEHDEIRCPTDGCDQAES